MLVLLNAPQTIAHFLSENITSKVLFLFVLNLVMFLLGMVLDVGPAIMIFAPMLLPFARTMGIDADS